MIEIIALFFLTRSIGLLALSKGLSPLKWKIITIVTWIAFEFLGVIVATMFFSQHNIVSILLVAIAFAITGYYLVRRYLEQLPDIEK